MASKKKEREALEKIADIIESVGGDESYIGRAFEGCYLVAQENIENDFFDSWKRRAESKDEEIDASHRQIASLQDKCSKKDKYINDSAKTICQQEDIIRGLREDLEKCRQERTEALQGFEQKTQDLETAKDEIIKLKAKLYDMMTADK